jgi:serine/threonine protein kinase
MVEPPQKIGPYDILRKIGEGGMGAVFEGVHELIERHVAVKVLHPEFAQRAEFVARFFNEARAVNRIAHPGLVQISDYGQLPDKSAYIVMEYLSGDSLATRIKQRGGPLPLEQVLNFGYQLADALAAAHAKEIIHRDLKPDNVMIVADAQAPGGERTKLLDFGIAKLVDDSGQIPVKTNTNAMMGTPYYMSPEQCRGAGQVDSRSDVYALGVMLYEMLAGERPFRGEGQGEIIAKHLTEEPEPLLRKAPQTPKAVAALVHRMLVKKREQRPLMQAVAIELEALSAEWPPPQRRRSTANVPVVSGVPASAVETIPPPLSIAGTAAGQANARNKRGRNLGLAGCLLLALCAVGGFTLRARQAPEVPKAVPTISLRTDSPPPGAEVVQAADGQVLPPPPKPPEPVAEPDDKKPATGRRGTSSGKSGSRADKKLRHKSGKKASSPSGGRHIED